MKQFYTYFFLLCLPVFMLGQNNAKQSFGDQFVKTQVKEKYELTDADLEGLIITDQYTSKHNGVTHIYYQQTHNGIPIHDAYMNLNITKDNKVPFFRSTFFKDVKSMISTDRTRISPEEAISHAASVLDLPTTKSATLIEQISKTEFKFKNSELARKDIPVKLIYQLDESDRLILTWDVGIVPNKSNDSWSIKIDANTGGKVSQFNYTLYCNMNHIASRTSRNGSEKVCNKIHTKDEILRPANMVSGSYLSYNLPIESPIHGMQTVVTQPHDPAASPFGWHDIDGVDGAEFTFTRGNNVHSFLDLDGDAFSSGDEPDGGPDLIFDFAHDPALDADQNYDPAVVNLFTSINKLHDLLYGFGFDEAAGNFQFNNYGNPGFENDHIIAKEADPGIANNASWSLSGDGISSEMSMGIWDNGSRNLFLEEPAPISGPVQDALAATDGSWGFQWATEVVEFTTNIVLATDGSVQGPTQCCNDIINGDDVEGNIALIDRGLCEFGLKSLNAQNAGAVGVLICNVEGVNGGNGEELVSMAGGVFGLEVTIPAIFVAKSVCDRIKLAISGGNDVVARFSNQGDSNGPADFNSSFDNGVIAHEFGHGVNSRLVGGPSNPVGLTNAEQMGEGWSDLFSVAFTLEEGDSADDPRGVGTYVFGQIPDGTGIRAFPYSRNMEISPYTYDDIIGQNEVHAIGEIWAAMCWDLIWNFIDLYGMDADWQDPTSGNVIAMQLVMDGFKLVGANPGFADARDAIIAADEINNNGEHLCMIWETFARRGLGFNADQGSPNDSNDGVEGFETLPSCLNRLRIEKSVTDFIAPGEDIQVTLNVGNFTADVSINTIITDNIPNGLNYVDGSANIDPTVNGDQLEFNLGDLTSLEEMEISYTLSSDPSDFSQKLVFDDIEDIGSEWAVDFLNATGFNLWSTTQLAANSPVNSWYVEAVDGASSQTLIYNDLVVSGDKPTLRFWHQINTTLSSDGGFVEISNDGGTIWSRIDDKFIRGGYERVLAYSTFVIPSLNAFSGESEGFVDSYVDLSDYSGQTISVRFRFGTDGDDEVPVPAVLPGWLIDDFELMDLLQHESAACIDADNLDEQCSPLVVTIVDSGELSSDFEANVEGFEMSIFPNPATDNVTINLETAEKGDYMLSVNAIDGQLILNQRISVNSEIETYNLDLESATGGIYIVRLATDKGAITRKLIIE